MQSEWSPMFWEPVAGSTERLMVGVVWRLGDQVSARRVLRDDVLDSLYGTESARPRLLIDTALSVCVEIARASGVAALPQLDTQVMGLTPGTLRRTEAINAADVVRQAILLYSSLSQLDGIDEADDADHVQPEEVNKRFATEVRDYVLVSRPEFAKFFNRSERLHDGGSLVRFGFLSDRMVLHFSVLHPVRQSASVSSARAKLWELARAKEYASLKTAALITAVPRADDPTLGSKQKGMLVSNQRGIELEADDAHMRFIPVTSVEEAAAKVVEMAA